MTSASTTESTVPLRVSVALVAVTGLVALACSQLLSPAWAILAGSAVAAGSYASFALPGQVAAQRR